MKTNKKDVVAAIFPADILRRIAQGAFGGHDGGHRGQFHFAPGGGVPRQLRQFRFRPLPRRGDDFQAGFVGAEEEFFVNCSRKKRR